MSKFKRALSALLAIAIVFGMFSCLAPAVAPLASAEETIGAKLTVKKSTDANGEEVTTAVDGILSYDELVAAYGTETGDDGLTDGFIYIASEYYEDDGELTDYNIQPGETLTAKIYVKSNMYLGEGNYMSFYDNSIWDVKTAISGTPTYDANGYTSGSQGESNTSHPIWTLNGYKNMVTSINITNVGWIKNTCGFDTEYLSSTDLVQNQTLCDSGVSSAPYQPTSDEWLMTHIVTLKDSVEVGTTVEITSPDVIWGTYVNDSTGLHDTRKRAYVPCAHITASGILTVSYCSPMCKQFDAAALDYAIRGLEHTFNVTETDDVSSGGSATVKPTYTYKVIESTYTAETQETPITFTSDKSDLTYEELNAIYGVNTGDDGLTDGFIYINSEFYEADGTLTDYYIEAGDTLTARIYVKSNMYLGEGNYMQFFDNSLWDVKTAISGTPSYDANGYTSGSQGESNTNHPIWTLNGYKNMVTSINITNVGWIKNTCGFDTEYLSSTDLIQNQTLCDSGVSSAPYQLTSDEWLMTYIFTAKEGLADGTELPVTSPDLVWGSWINPSTNLHDTRKRAYVPCAHITASGILTVSYCSPMCKQMDAGALDYMIRGLDHTFYIGDPPAAGTFTATFTADGTTVDTQNVATGGSITAPEAPAKDGYTFLGWALEGTDTVLTFPQTMGSANVTYVAVYAEVAKYTATFYVDGEVYGDVVEYAEGATIVAPTDPTKDGYTFAGWNPTVGTMGAEDITFNAQWTAKTYTVSFYKETTDTSAYQTLTATFDAAYNLPTAPTKTGYTFNKWVDADGADMPATHTVASDVSYYASWTAGTFNATFKANGGTFADGSSEIVVPTVFGEAIVPPADPTKAGGVFEGWSPEVGNMTAEGMTFTAQWSAAQIGVYFMDGDTQLAALTGDSGSDIAAMSPNPSKDGYTFKGWQYADGTTADFPITLGTEAVYVYAIWEAKSYYIEFYDASGNWLDGGNQYCGETIVTPDAPTVSGSTFVGWYDGDGNEMPETVPAIDNQVYYATYETAKYTATFYIDSDKTTVHHTYEAAYQSVIPAPETPVKEGYTFKWWSQDGKTTKVTFSSTAPKMPVNGITYVGQWTVNSYDIVYYVDGTEVNRETYTYGATITPWTYTPAAGETFSGWTTEIPATMPANEVSIYGTTGTAVYNATFTINGEEYAVVPVEYNTAITVPEYSVPEGYTFSGWTVPDVMPAGDQTYDATLTANTYNAIFYLDDAMTNVYTTVPTVYGEAIEFPADPEVAGKEFQGWDNDATVMGAGDMTFIAMFNNIEYFVEFLDEEGNAIDGYDWIAYYGDTVEEADAPEMTKEGYDFVGWFVDGVQVTFPYTVTEDVTFEAVYEVQSLKVVYYVDGSQYGYDPYEFGAAITLRDDLVKEGYTFSGWLDADGNEAVLPDTMPAEDITVYGTFTVNKYRVVFNAGEGTFSDGSKALTVDVDYGTVPVAPETPTLAGYGFKAWTPELTAVGVDGATYTATYAAGMVNYTIETYTMDTEGNYGDAVTETKSDETDAAVSVTPATLEGFTLDTANSVLSGVVAADGSTVLKVYYIRNQYDLTITIDGASETVTYYYGEAVAEQADPAKTGYTFEGWSEAIPATMPATDLEITAIFTINQYTITFVDTGDVAYKAITQDYATAIADVADPVKTGYTFAGWDIEIPETMPAEDLTITAQWTINQYTITFDTVGGTTIEPITQDYATAVTAPADPEKEGHNFTGWDVEIPATMPAEDLTITATWEAIIYDANFIIDGATTVVPTAFGQVPVAPTPTKVGYTFTGWAEGEVVAMVVGGATYTAVFEANTYDVIFDAAGGKFADGTSTVTVPTVFDQAIEAPADPTREAYIFAGWDKEVGTLTTEGITFTAQWTNDTSFCRVQNVELVAPTTLTSITKAAYEITVMESPVKVQIAGGEDYTFTWTYDRLDETVAGDLSEAGLVAIKAYNEAGEEVALNSADTAYEKWTIVTMLSEGAYKVRAKVGYTTADWEEIATAYDYTVEFADVEAVSDMIVSVTPAETVVKRGNTSTVTVVAKSEVSRLRLVMTDAEGSSLTVSFSPTATTYATVTDNGDGTSTWVLTMRFTYTGTDLEQDQKWVVWYRTSGGDSWLETDKAAEVKVTKYEQTDSPSTTYEAYSIVSVTAPTDAVKATYAPVVVVTTSDVTKVRLGYNGKTSTYLATSNNVTYVDNGDGTATWTINYRFATAGEQTWTAQCRGNKWSTATEFTFTVAEA